MSTYKIYTDQLTLIKEKPFKLEKEIQNIVEKNLQTLLGLDFIKTEFSIGTFRIDSLAFDSDKKSFVIIEYKRDKNFSVIDQGYAYLSLMLNNKAEFILEYNESKSGTLKRNDVDWSQSKVLFVSPNFTTYQKEPHSAQGYLSYTICAYPIPKDASKLQRFFKIHECPIEMPPPYRYP